MAPVTEAAFLVNVLSLASGLTLIVLMTLTLKVRFPSHTNGYRVMTKYINHIKYRTSRVFTVGMIDEHFMGEVGTRSRFW